MAFYRKIVSFGWNNNIIKRIKSSSSKYKTIEEKLKVYSNSNLPHTRKYLIKQLTEDPNFKTYKGIMLKEDFIGQYHKSRKESGKREFNYDFSKLPDFIKTHQEKVPVFVNEISTKTGKLIGEWETCFRSLVINMEENRVCAGMISKTKTEQYISTEEFIRRSKEKFPGKFEYDKTIYVNLRTPVILKCLRCGKYFSQVPAEHLNGTGYCPECAMQVCGIAKRYNEEELINTFINIYGDKYSYGSLIYENKRTYINVTNNDSSRVRKTSIPALLSGKFSFTKSKGEIYTEDSLKELNISYTAQKKFETEEYLPELVDIRKRVYVDFYIEHKDKTYIIEYNGIQHYKANSGLYRNFQQDTVSTYIMQYRRDKAISDFCKRNNYIFIEIPYIIRDKDTIKDGLDKIINGELDPHSIFPKIEQDKIEEYEQ